VPPDTDRRPISRWGKVQLVVLAVNIAFWGAILGYTLVADPGPPPDFLDDRAFPTSAEAVCAATMAEVESFGNAAAVDSIEARADLVDRQDVAFRAMLAELRALPRPAGEQGEWVAEWLGDWDTHVADREAWAAVLHTGEDPPFVETPKGSDQVSEAIDAFAEVNEMPSCATLGDV
jgi:hypothetical protein